MKTRNLIADPLRIVLAYLSLFSWSYGQNQYSANVGRDGFALNFDCRPRMATMPDGGFVMYHHDGTGHSTTRIDSTGQIVWKNHGQNVLDLYAFPSGKFATAAAYTYDNTGGVNRFGVILNMHDGNGQYLWQKRLDTTVSRTVHIQQARNGDLLVLIGSPNTNEFALVRVDTTGNILWSRKGLLDNNQTFLVTRFNDFDISPIDGSMAAIIKPEVGGAPYNRSGILFWDSLGNPIRGYYSDFISSEYEMWNNAEFDANNQLQVFGVEGISPLFMGGSPNSYNYLLIDRYFASQYSTTQVFDMINVGYFDDFVMGTVLPNGDRVLNFTVYYIIFGNPIPDDHFSVVISATGNPKAYYSTRFLQGDTLDHAYFAPLTLQKVGDSLVAFIDYPDQGLPGPLPLRLSVMSPYLPSCFLGSYNPLASAFQNRTHTPFLFTQSPTVLNADTFSSGLTPAPFTDSIYCNECNPLPFSYSVQDSGLTLQYAYPYQLQPNQQLLWDFGDGNTATQTSGTHTYAAAGNYTFCVKRTIPGCTADSVCINLTIQPCPQAATLPIPPVCYGDSLVAVAVPSGTNATYTWWINHLQAGSGLQDTLPLNPLVPNWLVLHVSRGLCVDSTAGQWVYVPPIPQPGLPPTAGYCAGSAVTLAANPGYASYVWSTGQTSSTLSVSTPGTMVIQVSDSTGCTGTDTVVVTEYSRPIVNLGPDPTICPGTTYSVFGPAGMQSYAWSNGPVSQGQSLSAPGTYALTVTDANGCTASDTLQLAHHVLPGVNLGPDGQFCPGDTVLLTTGLSGTHSWSTGSTTGQIAVTQPGNYSVSFTDANGCVGRDTVQWTQFPQPTVHLGPDTLLCEGDTLWLSGPAGMVAYQWSNGSSSPQLEITTDGMYSLAITDANGCQASDSIQVQWGPIAPIASFSASQAGNTYTFGFTGSGAVQDYTWDFGDGNSGNGPNPTHTYANPGTYTVCLVVTNACGADTFCQPQVLLSQSNPNPDHAVRIYPNPARGECVVEMQFAQAQETQITIVNALGQTVATWPLGPQARTSFRLDVAAWSPGVYHVVVHREGAVWTGKLRVE